MKAVLITFTRWASAWKQTRRSFTLGVFWLLLTFLHGWGVIHGPVLSILSDSSSQPGVVLAALLSIFIFAVGPGCALRHFQRAPRHTP